MAGPWNPNDPAALGLEWLPTRGYTTTIAPGQEADCLRIRSTSAETIRTLRPWAAQLASTSLPLFTILEVFTAGNEYPDPTTRHTVQLHPSADQAVGNWTTQAGSGSNLWQSIDDDVVYPPSGTDHIRIAGIPGASAYLAYVNDAAVPATARICKLRILSVDAVIASPSVLFRDFVYRIQHIPSGDRYTPVGASVDANIYGTLRQFDLGEINPRTNLPWTRGDVAEFGPAGDWALRVESVGDANVDPALYSLALEVTYYDVENRVAAGCWARPVGGPVEGFVTSNNLITLPAGTADWAKANGVDYSFMWRHALAPLLTGAGPFATDVRWRSYAEVIPGSDGAMVYRMPPAPGMAADSTVARDAVGVPTGPLVFEHTNVPALILVRSDAARSVDSQPYTGASITGSSTLGPVAQDIRQTTGVSQSYLGVRFVVSPPATGNSTLTVTVNRTSDGVQMGGSFAITATEARALPVVETTNYRLIEGLLSSAAVLATATQYEIRFTMSAGGDWVFVAPSTETASQAVTYGGSTDHARRNLTDYTNADVAAQLLIQPAAPATVTATVRHEALSGQGCYCEVPRRDFVEVTWPGSSLGGAFAGYDVERYDPDGVWRPIRLVTDITRTTITNHDPARNRPVKYRVRNRSTTGAESAWTESEFVVCQSYGAELILTSDAEPQLTTVYDIFPRKGTQFLNHEGDEVLTPSGADGAVVFMDPANRGREREYELVVNFKRLPQDRAGNVIGGDAMYDPIEALVRAPANMIGADPGPIPYVSVLDPYGNVTYGYVVLGRGVEDQPGHRYRLPISVRPLVFTPTVLAE